MVELDNYHQLIDECYQLATESIDKLCREFISETEKEFEQQINNASNNQMYMNRFENANIFRKSKRTIQEQLVSKIGEGFELFKAHELATHIRENDFHNEAWSLVDDRILEETICISTLSSEVNTEHKEKLWQLQQRLTYINKNIPVDESNNPLAAVQFFVALRSGLKETTLDIDSKLIIYKVLCNTIQHSYPTLLNKVNAFFINKNILPEIRYEKQQSHHIENAASSGSNTADDSAENEEAHNIADEGDAPAQGLQDPGIASPEGSSQLPLVNTIRNLLKRARNIGSDEAAVPISQKSHINQTGATNNIENTGSAQANETPTQTNQSQSVPVVFDESQIIEAVEAVQNSAATAHFFSNNNQDDVLTIPTNIAENSARVYNQLHQASPDGAINAKNMYTIDMVGMLFEYILSDENLPDSIKTLLSHLHTPFLKLAFLDEDFFENKEHKSRMLLDSLAEAGANWVNHDGTAQYDMYNEIKRVVQRAIKEFKNDVTLFAELLMEFNLLKKRVSHMHNLRERNSIEKKQGQEKHEQAKAIARQEIKKRIEGRKVPSSIISLLSPWFTYLTFTQLKQGTDSEQWRSALAVIDNLITYCSIKQVKDSSRLAEGFDEIIEKVKEGLINVAYNQSKSASILEELDELKNSVLNKEVIKTTTTKVSSSSGNNSENPSEPVLPDTPTPEEERVMNYIKLIEPGTWIEYNKQSRLKVTGFDAESRKYVLIDQSSQEVMMLTRLEFARDILSEKATVIDGNAKPLFARALERIHHNLDKQVKASSVGQPT